jgi:hypothetical protein
MNSYYEFDVFAQTYAEMQAQAIEIAAKFWGDTEYRVEEIDVKPFWVNVLRGRVQTVGVL